ncbi:MAG TPA: DMT family protein, partial [Sphingomicrobium sp.]
MTTIVLLMISNVFMTIAWYGQLKFPHSTTLAAILIGWSIALIE